ncbi:MAG: type II secretion system major pseudopilin GspG [Verrucomicrobiota bacterium]|jgi:general secretion pathway protein G|nr:type II secretion system major pseudopilin GspG [Verrucomicrobiota bacterium]
MDKRKDEMQRRDAGFTLVEILLVVVIIGILASVAVPRLTGAADKARNTAAKQAISNIESAIDRYEMDCARLPDSLQNLITQSNEKNWDGPYIRKAESLKDPWGNDYQYTKQGKTYTVASAGADGNFGTEDDIK